MAKKEFGVPEKAAKEYFEANYTGPLALLKQDGVDLELLATHQDGNATLGLTRSAQRIAMDTSVNPNTISGVASFFTEDGKDLLECTFAGTAPALKDGEESQHATVFVIFQGGKGRFEKATGTAAVEADLYPGKGFSEGTLKGDVILPA